MSSGKPMTTDDLFTLFYGNEAPEQLELPSGLAGYPVAASQQAPTACECGMSTVLGPKGDNPELHSDWCPVYRKRRDL